ncbi:DUF3429 domain-containing protein [Solimonas terrae]|uniref:DUF3429 domain-containing protein n=1 Tax=Solimonas terrae TaxID=1396819 RepID=A0A6M2BSF2_9GAMM|nr:DUF3429 domain-containing protein [Solimonas terrae]NGY05141.1 DUF3429 domain-containing protein [Solimonas terrae]
MKLPPLLFVLGYAGLLPFAAGPLWLSVAPQSAPVWLDQAWLLYAALIAAFMAGSFWGLALLVLANPAGQLGLLMSAALMLLAWGAVLLPFSLSLLALTVVFVLLAAAEVWRERVLDPVSSYFRLRIALTLGVLICIAWRYQLG